MSLTHRIYTILALSLLFSCEHKHNGHSHEEEAIHQQEEGIIHLNQIQFNSLGMTIDTLPHRQMRSYIQTNGELVLPPQSEASITAIIGANIKDIMIIEGDKVAKGQTLAYLSHPDIIQLQTEYVKKFSELEYAEQEYKRKKKLYEEDVSSGKVFQKAKSDYLSLKADVSGLEGQFELLGISAQQVREGRIFAVVPLKSPISGYVRQVNVRLGQYVQPNEKLIEVVNNHHIHGHFLVYEKDLMKVKLGQKVQFTVESVPGKSFEAEIISIGKVFEADPKAVSIHAEIDNDEDNLISGMYVRGRIVTNEEKSIALPEGAVVREGNRSYIFRASIEQDKWMFEALEVREGLSSDGWIEIRPMTELQADELFALNNAYYLFSEWKKEEAGHDH